ncbi:PorV/PorQ family protein [bacterium]|nr:PorV/PorQ family protein [bacterium]
MVRTKLFIACVLGGLTAAAPLAQAADPGDVGMLSLRMGLGAREAAMGGAAVAASEGAAALYWNPANNALLDRGTDLLLQHHDYLGHFDHEAAAVAHRAAGGVIGLVFSGFYAEELVRRGEDAVGVPEGTFRPYDLAIALSYARAFGERFAAGVNAKFVYQTIDLYSDSGLALDAFLTHHALVEGLVFGASLTNLGSQMNLRDNPFDLPVAARIGAAYTPAATALRDKVTLAADMVFPNDTTEKAHVGVEYRLLGEFALRAGSRLNYQNQGLTAGAGFRTGRLGIDYAFEESKVSGFDDGHKFSLVVAW